MLERKGVCSRINRAACGKGNAELVGDWLYIAVAAAEVQVWMRAHDEESSSVIDKIGQKGGLGVGVGRGKGACDADDGNVGVGEIIFGKAQCGGIYGEIVVSEVLGERRIMPARLIASILGDVGYAVGNVP